MLAQQNEPTRCPFGLPIMATILAGILCVSADTNADPGASVIENNPYQLMGVRSTTHAPPPDANTYMPDSKTPMDCKGLSLSYWRHWRDIYSEKQFKRLLKETIAPSVERADRLLSVSYFETWDMNVELLKALLLVNQLTLALSERSELPNPEQAQLNQSCQLVSGCRPEATKGFVEGCGQVNFQFSCDLKYWIKMAKQISTTHTNQGCSDNSEIFECMELAFDNGFLNGEVQSASCVLSRFADRNITTISVIPSNPY